MAAWKKIPLYWSFSLLSDILNAFLFATMNNVQLRRRRSSPSQFNFFLFLTWEFSWRQEVEANLSPAVDGESYEKGGTATHMDVDKNTLIIGNWSREKDHFFIIQEWVPLRGYMAVTKPNQQLLFRWPDCLRNPKITLFWGTSSIIGSHLAQLSAHRCGNAIRAPDPQLPAIRGQNPSSLETQTPRERGFAVWPRAAAAAMGK